MFSALLDTSVLWPSLQRDFLLSLAIEGLYRPLWSTAILTELEYHEARKLVERGEEADAAAAQARHLVGQMSTAFDDALVENWEPLEGSFRLPDPDDEHVVAAALVGGAGVIVTANLKDFPAQRIPAPIKVVSPAQFARRYRGGLPRHRPTYSANYGRQILRATADRRRNPRPPHRHVSDDRSGGPHPHCELKSAT